MQAALPASRADGYGDSERWKDIVAANKDKIPDPDMVKAGTIILIPE